jgi:Protein of unknown function (DUF3037)
MGSFYTIVRYIPDPIADERINVGAIVFDEHTVKAQFIHNWQRVQKFSGNNIDFLKDFAQELLQKQLSYLKQPAKWNKEVLMQAAERWEHSIQLTEPRASLKTCDELLSEITEKYLRNETIKPHRPKGRRQVISTGIRTIREILSERFESRVARDLVKRHRPVKGDCGTHNYDIVVENGHVAFALNTLAFESVESERLYREVDAVAFAALDVKKYNRTLPVAILAKEPHTSLDIFKYAERTFGKLKVPFFTDGKVEPWTRKQVKARF